MTEMFSENFSPLLIITLALLGLSACDRGVTSTFGNEGQSEGFKKATTSATGIATRLDEISAKMASAKTSSDERRKAKEDLIDERAKILIAHDELGKSLTAYELAISKSAASLQKDVDAAKASVTEADAASRKADAAAARARTAAGELLKLASAIEKANSIAGRQQILPRATERREVAHSAIVDVNDNKITVEQIEVAVKTKATDAALKLAKAAYQDAITTDQLTSAAIGRIEKAVEKDPELDASLRSAVKFINALDPNVEPDQANIKQLAALVLGASDEDVARAKKDTLEKINRTLPDSVVTALAKAVKGLSVR